MLSIQDVQEVEGNFSMCGLNTREKRVVLQEEDDLMSEATCVR